MKRIRKSDRPKRGSHPGSKPISTRQFLNEVADPTTKPIPTRELSPEGSRPPSWLRSSDIEDPLYRCMREDLIREIAPRDPIEWILADEFVLAQYRLMRLATWQPALLRTAHVWLKGAKRAAKSRLPAGTDPQELDERAGLWAARNCSMINPDEIQAENFLSRRHDLDSIHRRLVSARHHRDSALRQIEQRRMRKAKQVAQASSDRSDAILQEIEKRRSSEPEALRVAPGQDLPLRALRNGH